MYKNSRKISHIIDTPTNTGPANPGQTNAGQKKPWTYKPRTQQTLDPKPWTRQQSPWRPPLQKPSGALQNYQITIFKTCRKKFIVVFPAIQLGVSMGEHMAFF
jgi:hypothetical protein